MCFCMFTKDSITLKNQTLEHILLAFRCQVYGHSISQRTDFEPCLKTETQTLKQGPNVLSPGEHQHPHAASFREAASSPAFEQFVSCVSGCHAAVAGDCPKEQFQTFGSSQPVCTVTTQQPKNIGLSLSNSNKSSVLFSLFCTVIERTLP